MTRINTKCHCFKKFCQGERQVWEGGERGEGAGWEAGEEQEVEAEKGGWWEAWGGGEGAWWEREKKTEEQGVETEEGESRGKHRWETWQ